MLGAMQRLSAWPWLSGPHLPTSDPRMFLKGLVYPRDFQHSKHLYQLFQTYTKAHCRG